MTHERVGPELPALSDVAGERGVDALQPGLVLAPPDVPAHGHVHPVLVEHRHALDVAGARAAVADVAVDVFLGGGRVAVEAPDPLERLHRPRGLRRPKGLERIAHAVAAAEKHQRPAVDLAQGGRGPRAVEDPRADRLPVLGRQAPRGLIDHDQAGRLGLIDPVVLARQPVARVHVKILSVEEDRAVGRIVGAHAGRRAQVQEPEDVGVGLAELDGRLIVRGRVSALVAERAVVPVGQPGQVQAHDLVPVADHVHAVALDRGRRADPGTRPVQVDVALQLGHHELPAEAPVAFVEAQQHAAVALVARVAGVFVVRADEDLASGHHRGRVGLRAQGDGPLDILARGRVQCVGEPGLLGDHVPRVTLPPLRPVGRQGGGR